MNNPFGKINSINFILLIIIICSAATYSIATTRMSNNTNTRQSETKSIFTARIEHIGFNVSEPVAVASWYQKNLGMKLVRKGKAPLFVTFISDPGNNMMMEFYNKKKFPKLDFSKINYMSYHLAFMVDSINLIEKKLINAGATLAEGISKTPAGDIILMLRDPWGMPLELVERAEPMLKFTNIRPEHFATNTPDARAKANWYAKNLGMKIIRQGGPPDFGTFVSDSNKDMMLELYQKKDFPMIDYKAIDPISIHLAFTVIDIKEVKEKLIAAGAELVNDISKSASGDKVVVMRDPWGFPIQLIQRKVPVI